MSTTNDCYLFAATQKSDNKAQHELISQWSGADLCLWTDKQTKNERPRLLDRVEAIVPCGLWTPT